MPSKRLNAQLHCVYQNVGGFNTKLCSFFTAASGSDCDVIAVAETWITPNVLSSEIIDCNLYSVFRSDRRFEDLGVTRGGGVLLAVKNLYQPALVDLDGIVTSLPHVDIACCRVKLANSVLYIFVLYIPPGATVDDYAQLFECLEMFEALYGSNFVIFGDFNITNYVRYMELGDSGFVDGTGVLLDQFLDFFDAKQFNNVHNSRGRMLDLIVSNLECAVKHDTMPLLREDRHHPALWVTVSVEFPRPKKFVYNCSVRSYNFRRADFRGLYDALSRQAWGFLDGDDIGVDEACGFFYRTVYGLFDTFVPQRKQNGSSYPPWYSAAIRRKLAHKRNVYRKYKKSNSHFHLDKFRKLRLEIRCEISAAHRSFVEAAQRSVRSDPAAFWSFVNAKRNSSRIPSEVTLGGARLDGPRDVVEGFARYFRSVYNTSSDVVSPTGDTRGTFEILSVTESSVSDAIRRLKPKLSQGHDGIPSFLIRDCSPALIAPLTKLFNISLRTGVFPDVWKIGKVCPVFKSGSREAVENYRPISILPALSGVFERVLYDLVYDNVKDIISDKQHGFVKSRSTVTNLTCLTQHVSEVLDEGGQVDVIYTDFSKAFDRIDHGIILSKLGAAGFGDTLLVFFGSYLRGRRSYVQYMNYTSAKYALSSGVPQGSILGPLFFVLYINDICEFLGSHVLLYADDLKIYRRIRSLEDCISLQESIESLEEWCRTNLLSLNISKCSCLTFSRKCAAVNFDYTISSQLVARSLSVKDLGVTFDNHLTFNLHVLNVVKSANRFMGFIIRSCHEFSDVGCLKLLYYSFVRSQLEYASVVWSPFYNRYKQEIERVQRRFLKYMSYRQDGVYPIRGFPNSRMLDRFAMVSLESRRIVSALSFLLKMMRGLIDCDQLRSELPINAPTRSLRFHRYFVLPAARTNVMLKSPLYVMCRACNALCESNDVSSISIGGMSSFVYCNSHLFL